MVDVLNEMKYVLLHLLKHTYTKYAITLRCFSSCVDMSLSIQRVKLRLIQQSVHALELNDQWQNVFRKVLTSTNGLHGEICKVNVLMSLYQLCINRKEFWLFGALTPVASQFVFLFTPILNLLPSV